MRIEHPDISISGVYAGFKFGLGRVWIPALFQYFMGKLCLFVSFQSQVWDRENDSIPLALISVDR